MNQIRRLLHWGPIIALSIIIFLFSCTLIANLSWYPPNSSLGLLHLAIFCSWVFMILREFFKAAFDGPGYVPIGWRPDREEDEDFLQYCNLCAGFKAPRAHHCRRCKRCVMKMDHHCPWINNCVGHRNHKSFTLFLIFVIIGCSHAAIILILTCLHHLFWDEEFFVIHVNDYDYISFGPEYLVVFCLAIGLSMGVAVAVSLLLYYQIKSILTNQTGIEAWILTKADRDRPDDSVFIYPYDLGTFNNVKQVMTWSHDCIGDGLFWPVKDGCTQYDLTIEQLDQKALKRDRMILHKIVGGYNGSWFPLKYGLMVCYDMPWTDAPRMKVEKNDAIYVTRWRRRWLFGEKILTGGSVQDSTQLEPEKGWFPKHCAMEVYEDEDEFLKKLN